MEFKKYDRVLMREDKDCLWGVYIFYMKAGEHYYANDVRDKEGDLIPFKECIPFEGNERFIGTNEDVWMPKMGDIVLVRDYVNEEDWFVVVFKEYDPNEEYPYRAFNRYTDDVGYDTEGWKFCKPLVMPIKGN